MAFDFGAGLSAAGETVAKVAGQGALEAQKAEAERDKLMLADKLTTAREQLGRSEDQANKMVQIDVTQKFQQGEKVLDRASEEKRTGMTAGAHVAAANAAAAASKYHADSQERLGKLRLESEEKRTEMVTGTRKEVADANRDALLTRIGMTRLPEDSARTQAEIYVDTGKTGSLGARNTMAQVQIQALVPQILKERGWVDADGKPDEARMRKGWATVDAAKKDLDNQTKMLGQLSAFSETLHKNIAGLVDLKEGLGPTAVPVLDEWINKGRRAVGDPNIDALDFQLRAITTEAAKLTSNQLGIAGLPEGARNDYNAILNSFKNWETIERVIRAIESDGYNRLSATQSAINNANERIGSGQPSTMPRVETRGATPNNPQAAPPIPVENGVPSLKSMKPGQPYYEPALGGMITIDPNTNRIIPYKAPK